MAFTYTGGATVRDTGSTASLTHGLTINSGNLVVAYVNRNSTNTISADTGGAAWTEAVNEIPSGETSRHALYHKVADGTEPSAYGFSFGSSDLYQVIILVFTGTSPTVDAPANTHIQTTNSDDVVCGAYDGQVISDNAVAVVFGGKDNRAPSSEAYTTADNSYNSALGESGTQITAGAHRIYTTGETGTGDITIQTSDGGDGESDKTYSIHMSFVEGAAPVGGGISNPFNGPFGGPLAGPIG